MIQPISFVNEQLKIAFSHDTFWVELKSGFAILCWAIASNLFGGVDKHYVFLTLSLIANANFWEVTGVVLGLTQMAAVVFMMRALRWIVSFLASWWWIFIAMSIAINFSSSPSVALYVVFALSNLIAMIKIARLYE
jgi:hypothetical protein